MNSHGRPFTEAGFGNKFESGATKLGFLIALLTVFAKLARRTTVQRQLMAMFGRDSIRMAEQYTRGADQQRLAEGAMHLIEARDAKA